MIQNRPASTALPGKTVTFYTRSGCSLCDKAMFVVEKVGREIPFRLEIVDIAKDETLLGRYRWAIPVICIDGTEAFRHRVDERELIALLCRGENA